MSSQSSTNSEYQSRVAPAVFSNCLVDPDSARAARIRHRRQRALGISAFLEVSIVAAILIWPLFATGSKLVRRVVIPIPPYGAHHAQTPPADRDHATVSRRRIIDICVVCFHGTRIPNGPSALGNHAVTGPEIPGPDLAVGSESQGAAGLINIFSTETGPAPPNPESVTPRTPSTPIRRSEGVQSALLIHHVDPRYPPLALQSRREGTVQLHAVIARDGSIISLEVLSGDPLFIRDALDAVHQWRYRPTLLGGEPMEVETFITVNFRLSH